MKVVARGVADEAVRAQFGWINVLKAGAAQLIVLHHLAFYGPMSDHVRRMLPALLDWLGGSARIAVQVFLVISGFLVAKSLSPAGLPGLTSPLRAIGRRYAKLAPPFMAATLLAAAASILAANWMTHDSISAPATLDQLGAHALLLHGVLGYESLSAGAWYVAIDFQLYALTALLLWLGGHVAGKRSAPWLMPLVVTLGITVSLLHFNLDASWDNWAPYFFGSYGLGMLAWWASDVRRKAGATTALLIMLAVPTVLALAINFRSRIALALVVACALFLFGRSRTPAQGQGWSVVNRLGQISYSVFLIHFPVCLLVNAAFIHLAPLEPSWQALGMLTAWGASLVCGAAFHRWVEVPLGRAVHLAVEHFMMRPVFV
ncbi:MULTISPECIES: acyltransferase [unclassified Janthinobacterium]|uniref:acyltransferase family protein n=1 Tax=unclassified Janthinobacterium TaxID=2610881 RepID=UPI0016093C75|nr:MULTISPECIES: acyltransferase [unclassified Janthinobacterium]MBB5609020.1 peptidoglycan/LPS O-acetylase OafA/YrhL [Janthinobacterium sp. S3T4]MBB5614249.1 peptidoglycan/LPS O-acetylase OafA/YrhL [Janthinobacterium sp. S3M3]